MAEAGGGEPGHRWRWHVGALGLYGALSWLVIDHGAGLTGVLFGDDADSFAFLWFLKWYPYALAHHINPAVTHLVWQRDGLSVLWMSSIPVLAVLAAPLTQAWGPIPVYNALVLAAPVLSAWCMYRLCLRLTGAPWPAMFGGFLFGFSTYEMAQVSILNLSFTFLLPCLGWIAVARAQGALGRPAAVALLAAAAIGQFMLSTEVFATTMLFGAMGWAVAFGMAPPLRPALRQFLADGLIAAPFAIMALSPLLASMFSVYPYIHLPRLWPYYYVASASGLIVPSGNTLFNVPAAFSLVNMFTNDAQEQDSYIGLPMVLILYHYARGRWNAPAARSLSVILIMLVIFSLGPHLWMGPHYSRIRLPWAALMRLPLLGDALPVRFALFVAFVAAIMASIWVAAADEWARRRGLVAVLACVVLFPAPHGCMRPPDSAFFAPGREQAVLDAGRQLLILPFSLRGAGTYWQVENGFGFSQTGGYLGFPPWGMQHFAAVWELIKQDPAGIRPGDVADFAETTKADYIVAGPGTPAAEIAVIETLRWRERKVDDVTIFDVPAAGSKGG